MASSPEARELTLVDKVEFRIALADTDTKLQGLLNTYLPPLLLKLGSEHLSVRNKVVSICQHLNARVKPQNIRLPVLALIKQWKENKDSHLVRHFDLVYAQQGISRLSTSDQADLFPVLASNISSTGASVVQGQIYFNLLLRTLIEYKLPPKGSPENENLRQTLGLTDDDALFLSGWFAKLMLLRLPSGPNKTNHSCPGLSGADLAFLTLEGKFEIWSPSTDGGLNITEVKVKALNLLASGAFRDNERLFPVLQASGDPNSRIADTAEDLLKRAVGASDLGDTEMIRRLFNLYFGQKASEDKPFVPPASMRLRTRILGILNRSAASSRYAHEVIRLVEEDLLQDFMVSGEASKTDREVSKLRSAVVNYLVFVAGSGAKADVEAIARPVIQSLRLFIEQEAHDTKSLDVKQIRGKSFEIIGSLAAASRAIVVEPNLELLRWLFHTLGEEIDKGVVVSIDQALSALLQSLATAVDGETEMSLSNLLLRCVKQQSPNSRNVRYAAVRFANRCLPFQNVVARWINLSVLGDANQATHEALEEARRGLDPYWNRLSHAYESSVTDRSQSTVRFPHVTDLVEYFFWDEDTVATGDLSVLALGFCRQALIWNGLAAEKVPIESGSDWDRRLDLAVSEDVEARKSLRKHFSVLAEEQKCRSVLMTLSNMALTSMSSPGINTKRRVEASKILVEFCTLFPKPLLISLADQFTALESAILDNDADIRSHAAQAYALLTAPVTEDETELSKSLERLSQCTKDWKEASGSRINQAHGAILALASFTAHRKYYSEGDTLSHAQLGYILPIVLDVIDTASDTTMLDAACSALSLLSIFYCVTVAHISSHLNFDVLLEKLSKRATAADEKAIATIGHLALILDEDAGRELQTVVDRIHNLHEIRKAESQFGVGEALASATCGWDSRALLSRLDIDGPVPSGPHRKSTLGPLLDRMCADAAAPKPSLRKASVLWLLCFIQFCSERHEVQQRLRQLQAIFKRCLSDRDELVQESASRGLGLVYEKGNRELKDDLVRDLVSSFSSDRTDTTMSGTVSEDTELFAPGQLPTGEGSSVSTYKDIMALASEVGDSSLVYRFMNLASSDALWSSRAAFGRFGLSNVLSDSSVDGYLASNPKLYPKLYRYRFDPNSKVRNAMNEIWKSLVKDPTATVELHFSAIIDDLLVNILGKEWRVRQACCAALADLVQGRTLEKLNPYLDQVWTQCFKVLDDIKGSVRSAAAELSRVLIGIVLRTLEADSTSSANATKVLESVIPFLFSPSGLESSAEDVKSYSVHTLLEIVKKAKPLALRPFIPGLVENLIGLLTGLESHLVNYLYLNASKYNLDENEIDSKRLAGVRGGPLMEAIERCLDGLDDASMQILSSKLQSAMRSAVGVPSKVGCALVLVSLSTRKAFLFRPYADVFLNAIPKYISDRNETVSQSYAASLGYVARGASDQGILKIAALVQRFYFESEDDKSRATSGEIVRAVAKYSTDRFNSLSSEFLPITFIARHDDNADVKKIFDEVWKDNTGGPRAASLYLENIIKLASTHLASHRWTIKHAAALAIGELVTTIGATHGSIPTSSAETIWPSLKQALAEKSWEGKEKLLDGFVVFAQKTSEAGLDLDVDISKASIAFLSRPSPRTTYVLGDHLLYHQNIATREAKRRNPKYQSYAIGCLAQIAACCRSVDLNEDVCRIVESVLSGLGAGTSEDGDRMDVDGGTASGSNTEVRARLIVSCVEAVFHTILPDLAHAYPAAEDDNYIHAQVLRVQKNLALIVALCTISATASHRASPFLTSIFENANSLFEQMARRPLPLQQAILTNKNVLDRLTSLLFRQDDAMTHAPQTTKMLWSEAALALARLLSKLNGNASASLRDLVAPEIGKQSSQAVRNNLADAIKVLDQPQPAMSEP